MPDARVAQPALPAQASPTGRGRRATTSTSRSARATCRPTRCRWRSPTARSPTAGAIVTPARRPAGRGRRRAHRCSRSSPGARRRDRHRPRPRATRSCDGLHAAANEPGGTSAAGLRGLPDHGRRQDRHRRARRRRATSPGTSRSRPYERPAHRRRGDDRARRLRRRGRGARSRGRSSACLLRDQGQEGRRATAGDAHPTDVAPSLPRPRSARACSASASRARGCCGSTCSLLLATLGLIAFSLVTLDRRRPATSRATPHYYVDPPGDLRGRRASP